MIEYPGNSTMRNNTMMVQCIEWNNCKEQVKYSFNNECGQ